jgi:hypothetical protein
MPASLPTKDDQPRLRFRGAITTMLLLALSIMIVWDLLARRWAPAAPPSPDMTRHSP